LASSRKRSCWSGATKPADTTSFAASSTDRSSGITSLACTKTMKPVVGFGPFGMNTVIIGLPLPIFSSTSSGGSPARNTMA
jgi:hypothetical protein